MTGEGRAAAADRMVAGMIRKPTRKALPIIIGTASRHRRDPRGRRPAHRHRGVPDPASACCSALLAAMILFGRFAQSAQYAAIAGQPARRPRPAEHARQLDGTPAIAGNRNMDVVHRVVGRPGVILVGEGSPIGLASLLAAEKKKIARIAYGVPIYEIQVGNERGRSRSASCSGRS